MIVVSVPMLDLMPWLWSSYFYIWHQIAVGFMMYCCNEIEGVSDPLFHLMNEIGIPPWPMKATLESPHFR